jgi:hypothetical protein
MLVSVTRRIVSEKRRKAGRTWVQMMTENLEHAGASRDRPRQPHETVREYVLALTNGPLPDERLYHVGEAVTKEAFGDRPNQSDQAAAEQLLAAIAGRPMT